MSAPQKASKSPAVKASWVSLGLALAGLLFCVLVWGLSWFIQLDVSGSGPLYHRLVGAILSVLFVGQLSGVVLGITSFLLIRQDDRAMKAVVGIVIRAAFGIAIGLIVGIVTYFTWANIAIGI